MKQLLLVLLTSACAAQPLEIPRTLYLESAYDTHERVITEGAVQLLYKARLTFPRQAIDADRAELLKGQGWTQCLETHWQGFLDSTMQPPRFTHQSQRVFVKNNDLVVAGMRYYSYGNPRDQPENDEQHVVILKYDLRNGAIKKEMVVVFPKCLTAE
ncbi:MAG TPA: hypothetical protein VFJ70_13655 [Burkholderiales bacterium]|nr:hypothetical protein [Burkholderiales bacterium]